MKILCTGDIHIGRRPTRLPPQVDGGQLSTASIWDTIVEYAIGEQVDVVALTGDLVDRDNRFFEAYGPLERGIRRLADARMDIVAVAGNHDFDVLPRLADSLNIDRFHLLGRHGQWQRFTIRRDTALHFDGWSFPAEHVPHNPLDTYDLEPDEVPAVGLLHADLDQFDSVYAPVSLAQLRQIPVSIWLLGHIHRPTLHDLETGPAVLYPGSPQGLDPGEPGPHGPWMIQLGNNRRCLVSHVPLAHVRYDGIDVDLGGTDSIHEFERRVPAAMHQHLERMDHGPLKHMCCRLRLTGGTAQHLDLEGSAENLCQNFELTRGTVTVTVEKVLLDTRPAVDIEALSLALDAPGALAKVILDLQAGQTPPQTNDLLREAQHRMTDVRRARAYSPLGSIRQEVDSTPDLPAAQALLIRQGLRLLDTLLAQKQEKE